LAVEGFGNTGQMMPVSERPPPGEPEESTGDAESETGLRRWWKVLGPGVVTGAADDDPSSIATYAQAGAKFGLSLLWTALITLPLMAAVQEICDRTAMATGKSLGALARERFGGRTRAWIGILIGALLVANMVNIAADLVAVGEGVQLLHAGPAWVWSLAAGAAITIMLMTGSFQRIELVFKILCLSLLAYVAVLAVISVNWGQVALHTFVPHVEFTKDYLSLLVAVLGSTITPCLFFWQGTHRIEQMREEDGGDPRPLTKRSRRGADRKERGARADVFAGMTFSQLVMFGIITATASTLGAHGQTDVASAAQAAGALKPVAGPMASILFALGFIGSGMLAVPILAGSVSAGLSGLTGKPWGLSKDLRRAPFFYSLLVLGTVGGTALTATGLDPIKLLVLSAIVNGLAAAPFLVLVMVLSENRQLMGDFRNRSLARVLGWFTVALMSVASIAMLVMLGLG
jgi:NRAMP (natural resistance-associated macrophage protein)-like metal ion transporter